MKENVHQAKFREGVGMNIVQLDLKPMPQEETVVWT